MKGVFYGIGVGPGDPELMTLKAVRLIGEMDIIAAPGEDVKKTTAYTIALQAVPEIADKELLPIHMPMVMDREFIAEYHRRGAEEIAGKLEEGNGIPDSLHKRDHLFLCRCSCFGRSPGRVAGKPTYHSGHT